MTDTLQEELVKVSRLSACKAAGAAGHEWQVSGSSIAAVCLYLGSGSGSRSPATTSVRIWDEHITAA